MATGVFWGQGLSFPAVGASYPFCAWDGLPPCGPERWEDRGGFGGGVMAWPKGVPLSEEHKRLISEGVRNGGWRKRPIDCRRVDPMSAKLAEYERRLAVKRGRDAV